MAIPNVPAARFGSELRRRPGSGPDLPSVEQLRLPVGSEAIAAFIQRATRRSDSRAVPSGGEEATDSVSLSRDEGRSSGGPEVTSDT